MLQAKHVIVIIAVLVIAGMSVWVISRDDAADHAGDVSVRADACLRESIEQDSFDHYDQTEITARAIGGTDLAPVSLDDAWRIVGEDILWRDSTGEIFVDEKWFGDLNVTDVTGIGPNDAPIEVGMAMQALLEKATPQEIIEGLMHTQVIRLYAHLSGYACAMSEETVDGVYMATYEGEHSYCTNECVDARLAFRVSVDSQSGAILLVGAP